MPARSVVGHAMTALAIVAVTAFASPSVLAIAEENPLVRGAEELSRQIVETYKTDADSPRPRVAVLEFSDLDGRVSDAGRLLSEEIITRLFLTKRFEVVERLLLNKVMKEHKLQIEGIVDPATAKQLGKILGVEAIVSGTCVQVDEGLRVNARIISTETGSVSAVASTSIPMPGSSWRQGAASGATTLLLSPGLLFFEDFSSVQDGLVPTGWETSSSVMVRTLPGGRKSLFSQADGKFRVGIPTPDLPPDFRLTVSQKALCSNTGFYEQGVVYSLGNLVVQLNAQGAIKSGGTTMEFPGMSGLDRTIVFEKKGAVVRVLIDGAQALLLRVPDFKPANRFEILWHRFTFRHWYSGATKVIDDLFIYSVRLERL